MAIALYANIPGWWSIDLIILETILVTFYLFTTCFKSRTLNPKELIFISWGGTIRGAIAFALVMKIPTVGTPTCTTKEEYCFTQQNYELMVSTTLMICYITTIVFATFLKIVQKICVPA
jgi:hypothetical protein